MTVTRRRFLQTATMSTAALGASALAPRWAGATARHGHATAIRAPDSLPFPNLPAGQPTGQFPFDHIVLVMQENHSFDNYFGMLPKRGQPLADGFTFNAAGQPINSNPYGGGLVYVERAPTLCQPTDISQSWDSSHKEVDNGHMDGFAIVDQGQMYYYDQPDIPFYYSFANAFCVANRWFCSVQAQTYPNRRFYLAGSAYGAISTTVSNITQSPPNGTIVDRLNQYGISWKEYFVDVPATSIIFEIPEQNPTHMTPIAEFFTDCAAGTLPSVSWVSSDIGALAAVAGELPSSIPIANGVDEYIQAQNQDEENPADISIGENFVSQVVNAVTASPAWDRTLLIWLYDEHGGYYDHVAPPAAIKPDNIAPETAATDYQAGYDTYGVRVPAVIASPYSKPHAVSNTVCDHTSVLATIEAQWNLPALTYRDANANTVASFLQSTPSLIDPPALAAPGAIAQSEIDCSTTDPTLTVHPASSASSGSGSSSGSSGSTSGSSGKSGSNGSGSSGSGSSGSGSASGSTPGGSSAAAVGRFEVKVRGRSHKPAGLIVDLQLSHGELTKLTVELLKGDKVVARTTVAKLSTHALKVVLREPASRKGKPLAAGNYTLKVTAGKRTWLRRTVKLAR